MSENMELESVREQRSFMAGRHSMAEDIVYTVGGTVEGHPTSPVNVLQRVRELVDKEAKIAALEKRLAPITQLLAKHPAPWENAGWLSDNNDKVVNVAEVVAALNASAAAGGE